MKHLPPDKDRILGLETEYIIHPITNNTSLGMTTLEAGISKADLPISDSLTMGPQGFLSSGARLYVDIGDHIEYATPECTTGEGLLASHLAGERIVQAVNDALYPNGPRIYKQTMTADGNTCGEHENYLTGSEDTASQIADFLLPHLVTRQVLVGPGMVRVTDSKASFVLDQRVWAIGGDVIKTKSVGADKPFFLNRVSEPLGKDTNRLQIVSGSHNRFPFSIAARMVMTSWVIRLIEQRAYPKDLILGENPFVAAKRIAADRDLRATVELQNGKKYTAAEIQYEIAIGVLKLMANGDATQFEQSVVEAAAEASADLAVQELDGWAGHIEWLAKLQKLEDYKHRKNVGWDSAPVRKGDAVWHRTDRTNPLLPEKFLKTLPFMPSDYAINKAMTISPDPTRARRRGKAIETRKQNGVVNWNSWTENKNKKTFNNPWR